VETAKDAVAFLIRKTVHAGNDRTHSLFCEDAPGTGFDWPLLELRYVATAVASLDVRDEGAERSRGGLVREGHQRDDHARPTKAGAHSIVGIGRIERDFDDE